MQQQQPDIDHNPQLWETNFRVTKIRNLGYKSKKRELERENLSSRWSWLSESSANRSSMVALCSPCTAFSCCCTPFMFLASNVVDVTVEERRKVVEVTVEERREVMNGLHCLRSCSWPASWVEEKWDRYGRERERKMEGNGKSGRESRAPKLNTHLCTCFLIKAYGPRAGPFWPAGWPDGLSGLTGRAVSGWRLNFLTRPMLFWSGWRAGPSGPAHFDIPNCNSRFS